MLFQVTCFVFTCENCRSHLKKSATYENVELRVISCHVLFSHFQCEKSQSYMKMSSSHVTFFFQM
uniref:Uncharacterized protein n=1 Tax=Anguilla anguilla TaxID=7936 RepID=A0A0E9QTS4_ANGAN